MNRWDLLSDKQKEIVRQYIDGKLKMEAIARDLGLSATRVKQLISAAYIMLDVHDHVGLALWVGRNWDLVHGETEKPKAMKERNVSAVQ